ncbi:MAG: hypothetical protein HBSIN02_14500 [Bacteroidia bacterium]|nr:MAG: hypothetical protein HBSIN02_14500 [Bacteroidia bacterium]
MHPILSQRRIFLLYLTIWAGAGGFLAVLLSATVMAPGGAAIVAVPMMLVYSFMCLASYYLCRTFPLSRTNILRLLAAHGLAAAVTSTLWISLGRTWVSLLSEVSVFALLPEGYESQIPLLFGVGVVMFLLSVAVNYSIITFNATREAERQAMELRFLAQEAELRALRSQINPHFLFNSLNSISALTTHNPEQARAMTLGLADFLRKTLATSSLSFIPLSEEVDLVNAFLSIERIRFGKRLRVDQTVDPAALSCPLPPLLLQPLVENAVAHGIGHIVDGGTIDLRVERQGNRVMIVVRNPVDPDRPAARGHGIGLQNVRDRLAALYGGDAHIDIDARPDEYEVTLLLPADGATASIASAMQFS